MTDRVDIRTEKLNIYNNVVSNIPQCCIEFE